ALENRTNTAKRKRIEDVVLRVVDGPTLVGLKQQAQLQTVVAVSGLHEEAILPAGDKRRRSGSTLAVRKGRPPRDVYRDDGGDYYRIPERDHFELLLNQCVRPG